VSTHRIGNVDVNYRLTGQGRVTIVITQGLGLSSAEWWPLQDSLSKQARVLTWDRPGYGSSGSPTSARTVVNISAEALELVGHVAPEGPLVLVGHSQGGLYTNALARIAGVRVQGVVLLDPAHPDNGRLRRELPRQLFQSSHSDLAIGIRMGRRLARLHLMGILRPIMMKGPPFMYCTRHPPVALNAMWRHLERPLAYEAALAEYEELEFRTTSVDLDAMGAFPAIPLAVLIHDPALMTDYFVKRARLPRIDAERVEAVWGLLLRDHVSLSPLGTLESVAGSGHLIHLEKPDLTEVRIADLLREAGPQPDEFRPASTYGPRID
jgi:pimeloyl-ACP methyl ester carboxylesterase